MRMFILKLACFVIASLIVILLQAPLANGKTIKVPCYVQYTPLTPTEAVGTDGCGHTWKIIFPMSDVDRMNARIHHVDHSMAHALGDSVECYYWNLESGAYMRINCPAPGSATDSVAVEVIESGAQ